MDWLSLESINGLVLVRENKRSIILVIYFSHCKPFRVAGCYIMYAVIVVSY